MSGLTRPDTHTADDDDEPQEITMAYEVLSDVDMRKRYDQFGKDGLEEGSTHNPEARPLCMPVSMIRHCRGPSSLDCLLS